MHLTVQVTFTCPRIRCHCLAAIVLGVLISVDSQLHMNTVVRLHLVIASFKTHNRSFLNVVARTKMSNAIDTTWTSWVEKEISKARKLAKQVKYSIEKR